MPFEVDAPPYSLASRIIWFKNGIYLHAVRGGDLDVEFWHLLAVVDDLAFYLQCASELGT